MVVEKKNLRLTLEFYEELCQLLKGVKYIHWRSFTTNILTGGMFLAPAFKIFVDRFFLDRV